jgi:uncharacterized membrane protein
MSKYSNAFFGGIYRGAMRFAAPILFCTAILLFVSIIGTYSVIYWLPMIDDDPTSGANIYFLFDGLFRAIKDSTLIFAGAAIVWAINANRQGEAQ